MSVINNRTDNYMSEPWMIELWEWADNFEISAEHLPRNAKELLAITDLDLRNKNLDEYGLCCELKHK